MDDESEASQQDDALNNKQNELDDLNKTFGEEHTNLSLILLEAMARGTVILELMEVFRAAGMEEAYHILETAAVEARIIIVQAKAAKAMAKLGMDLTG